MRPSVSDKDVLDWLAEHQNSNLTTVGILCRKIAWVMNDPAVMKQWRAELQDRARKREHGK